MKKKRKEEVSPPRLRLRVSIHTLAAALDCRTALALKLSHREDAGEPRPGSWLALMMGKWGHAAMAAWLNEEDWGEALAPYEAVCDELGIQSDRRGYANLRTILASYTESHNRERLPFDLLDRKTTEVSFVVPIGEVRAKDGTVVPVDLIGYIDKLVRDKKSGRIMPLEHKFTGQLNAEFVQRFVEYDPQTTAYILAASRVLGEECDAAWVNAIEVRDVPKSATVCKKHGVPYSECGPLMDVRDPHIKATFIPVRRDRHRQAEFVKQALDICERYVLPVAMAVRKNGDKVALKTPRDGIFTGSCDRCEFRRWCMTTARGRTAFDAMLRSRTVDDTRLMSGLVEEESE